MIQIEDTIVSFDIFVKKFCCDLAQCRGICCVEGDSGAPLEEDEPVRIETNYENIRAYMKPEGIAAVKEQGRSGWGFGDPIDSRGRMCLCHRRKRKLLVCDRKSLV